jgi:hypothetical protein
MLDPEKLMVVALVLFLVGSAINLMSALDMFP